MQLQRYLTLALSSLLGSTLPALDIVFDFSNFNAGPSAEVATILNNDAWNGSTPDSTRLAASRAVMEQAAIYIETAAGTAPELNFTQVINVGWSNQSGSLALGTATWFIATDYPLTTGALNWDGSGTSTFFVDTTPANHSEFNVQAPSSRSATIGGNSLNVENIYFAVFSSADAGQYDDMLTTTIHEILHTIGITGGYPRYQNLDTNSSGVLDLSANGSDFPIAYNSGHTSLTLPWAGPGSISTYYPNSLGPVSVKGTRVLLTDLEVLILGNVHGVANFDLMNDPMGTLPSSAANPTWWPNSGWSYMQWPYLYEANTEKWRFYSQASSNNSWHNHLDSNTWSQLNSTSGWMWYGSNQGYFYQISTGGWHYYSPSNVQWINDLSTNTWAVFTPGP